MTFTHARMPDRSEQVLMNLVVTPRTRCPGGGRVTIKTQSLRWTIHCGNKAFIRPGEYVTIRFPTMELGWIRRRSRVSSNRFLPNKKGKGKGLGLSTVYGIVKQSAGYVMVESEPGVARRSSFICPEWQRRVENRHAAPLGQAPEGGLETVLLVEDEESVRQLVRETLQGKGYECLRRGTAKRGWWRPPGTRERSIW